jgi:hypothetical protein
MGDMADMVNDMSIDPDLGDVALGPEREATMKRAELNTEELENGAWHATMEMDGYAIWHATMEMDGYAIHSGHHDTECEAIAKIATIAFEMWALDRETVPETP